ncbi:stage II sporulation protein M [archaeon]|nr:stage II sporulation protein M [archaeon]MBT6697825.1 stage II sporulation protein M [archaeon]
MVLESLFNPFAVKRYPWEMFIAGVVYSLISLFLAYISFREHASLLMVFFIVMSAIPLIYNAIKNEEEIDLKIHSEWKLLREHAKVLLFLLYFFFGVVVSLAAAYVLLPSGIVEQLFSVQTSAIVDVQNNVQGNLTQFGLFGGIFLNNLKVLLFCLIFSFLFGVGAIFILTWNASVVAVAVGNLFKTQIASLATEFGSVGIMQYFGIGTVSFFRYMFHGVIEIAAYFVAGIAGSIISIAVIKHNLEEESVLYDALDLVLISLILLLFAGVVEVYVTPLIFSIAH